MTVEDATVHTRVAPRHKTTTGHNDWSQREAGVTVENAKVHTRVAPKHKTTTGHNVKLV